MDFNKKKSFKSANMLSMITLLLENKVLTARDLSEKLEVSPRTIFRYVEEISATDIPITMTKGRNGGIQILDTHKLDKRLLSSDDLSALVSSLKTLEITTNNKAYSLTLDKIKSLIPSQNSDNIILKANQILIDTTTWDGVHNSSSSIEIIKDALNKSCLLSFEYTDNFKNETLRICEPYRLILKGTYWYLYAFCRTKNSFRKFKLSRISNLTMLDESFTLQDIDYSINPLGSWSNPNTITVKLIVKKTAINRILEFYGASIVSKLSDDTFEVLLPFANTDDEYDYLIGFSDKCKVIEPLSVKNELISRLTATLNLY
ncbi:YafY family protein [uncultured Clostridium sp.]|uniref:helix-turn-helix transcriptional regulator n=1 Tax=uncultured Clostridium sp. TaxID=59620 RepID=UPI00260F5461|nr:YafY family protein [uncultured Clostridium sp.]